VTALVGWQGSRSISSELYHRFTFTPVAIDLAANVAKKFAVLTEDVEAWSAWHRVHLDLIEKTLSTIAKLFGQVAIIGSEVL